MIARLHGVLVEKKPAAVVVDVQGVGYEVFVSLVTFCALPETGQPVTFNIATIAREDALHLYGFLDNAEKELFTLLIGVSKIGPKLALTILSGLEYRELARTLANREADRLATIPGIGKKTAERLVMELSEKLGSLAGEGEDRKDPATSATTGSSHREEAIEALLVLGYKRREAVMAVDQVMQGGEAGSLEELLRRGLAILSG